jgi:dynactin complex subunit
MSEIAAYIGQRLSLKSQTCTVRYVGQVADKQGQWLGVEWDDASRGKHDGTHEGVSYFKCRSICLFSFDFSCFLTTDSDTHP